MIGVDSSAVPFSSSVDLSAEAASTLASSKSTSSVSMGRAPRNVNPSRLHISSPPPVENTLLISPQQGHTYPDMFSIRPMTGRLTVRVKDRHLPMSVRATTCGVVTSTEESRSCTGARCSNRDRCSSEVPVRGKYKALSLAGNYVYAPGGVSMTK